MLEVLIMSHTHVTYMAYIHAHQMQTQLRHMHTPTLLNVAAKVSKVALDKRKVHILILTATMVPRWTLAEGCNTRSLLNAHMHTLGAAECGSLPF